MKNLLRLTAALLLAFIASPVSAAEKEGKDPVVPSEPTYDTATVITIKAAITEVREVPKDKPLAGIHLTVQSGAERLDVFVGPSDFVKIFDVTFAKGEKIEVIGSKVQFDGTTVVLAREVQIGSIALLLRDKDGSPFWKFWGKPPVG